MKKLINGFLIGIDILCFQDLSQKKLKNVRDILILLNIVNTQPSSTVCLDSLFLTLTFFDSEKQPKPLSEKSLKVYRDEYISRFNLNLLDEYR